jgi:hypothetical protein
MIPREKKMCKDRTWRKSCSLRGNFLKRRKERRGRGVEKDRKKERKKEERERERDKE